LWNAAKREPYVMGDKPVEIADHRHHRHRRLLSARGERPCHHRAAEKRDELAPFHSISLPLLSKGCSSWQPGA
jgi:hypothetical protein